MTKDKDPLFNTRKPSPEDYATAERNNPDWESLTTRKKNRLTLDEMFHREYYALAEAIMGVRRVP